MTRDNVILRQIPLYPGQPLTYPDLSVAERNLTRLNIFESDPAKGIKPTLSSATPTATTNTRTSWSTSMKSPPAA